MAALALAVLWLGGQRRMLSSLQEQTAALRKPLAGREPVPPDLRAVSTRTAGARHGLDSLLKRFGAARPGSLAASRARREFELMILEASDQDLAAALREIQASEIPGERRDELLMMAVQKLGRRDPRWVLESLPESMGDNGSALGEGLADAFPRWLEKDPEAATAWMDARTTEGRFESRRLYQGYQQRVSFEGHLIARLLASDPAAAASRLAGLPEEERAGVFYTNLLSKVPPGREAELAGLIRSQLSTSQQTAVLGLVEGISDPARRERLRSELQAGTPSIGR